uniref:Putative LAGLIDADG homing endonuclease n=1 Tax=Neodangemannia microcystis TaxID=173495 RepID=A0A1W6EHA8_9CHLO|nr:putative LAGLIDADG homing endonuclease [Neodangemannia microcystis]YP_009367835.1 putative LAGLIDADG homing endonuclease [Neodangemannia microcystis]ARK14804.1 putative LAGLIDADG homing endonuclease [Neodangemannia microcystis]ARK14808.1 putative LAGLIDADG homing endonuclease [Neodangemannia microcystis]
MDIKHVPDQFGYYIAGFADGEGSFNCSFRGRKDYLIGWKITPVFNIRQKEKPILEIIRKYLDCGKIRFRSDGVFVYEVTTFKHLEDKVVPFFKKFNFLSDKKKKDFSIFIRMLKILKKPSVTYDDVVDLLELRKLQTPSNTRRKFKEQEILNRAQVFWNLNSDKILAKQ